MKKRICIIIPYFGPLPKNMYTFLLSCKKNKLINWLIFTDQDYTDYKDISSNVKFIKSNLNIIKNKIIDVTGNNYICLNSAYKLCDYKPLYGLIFSRYLKAYDYWGYSDLDIVYGNLYKYIKNGIENKYNKIGINGHLTLFKNSNYMNNIYKLPIRINNKQVYLFRDFVSKYNKIFDFDEFKGVDIICKQYNIKTYVNHDLVCDLLYENLDLNTNDRRFSSRYSCYIWNNGHAQYYYVRHGHVYMHEYGYFHFQKRLKFVNFIPINADVSIFSITTRGYNNIKALNLKSIKIAMKRNKSPFLNRLLYILHWYLFTNTFTSEHIGHIYLPVKYILWRILIRHDFKI